MFQQKELYILRLFNIRSRLIVCDERRCNNVRIRITNNRRKAELATDMYLPPLDLDLALSPNPPKRLERLANVLAYWNKQLSRQAMCGEHFSGIGKMIGVRSSREGATHKATQQTTHITADKITYYGKVRHTKRHSKRHT